MRFFIPPKAVGVFDRDQAYVAEEALLRDDFFVLAGDRHVGDLDEEPVARVNKERARVPFTCLSGALEAGSLMNPPESVHASSFTRATTPKRRSSV